MPLLLQVVVTGLATGAGYGLVAIGYALVFRLTGVVHFALGELVGLAAFITLAVAAGTGPATRTNLPGGRSASGLAAGLAVAVAAGVLVYVVAVRPFLRRGSLLGWVGGVVAVAFAVRGLLEASFVRQSYVFPDVLRLDRLARGGVISLGSGVTLQVRTFFVIAVGVALAAGAAWLLDRTRPGLAMQAIAQDPDAALIIGLPVDRLLAAGFALAGVLATLAAVLEGPVAPVTAETGAVLGLKGLVAAVIVGFGSPGQAMAAGLGVGMLETAVASLHLGPVRLGPAWKDIVPLALAVAAITVRHRAGRPAEIE